MIEFTLEQVAQMLNGEVEGDATAKVGALGKIEEATSGELSFLANPKYEHHIYSTNATAVIVSKEFTPTQSITTNLIKVEDPYSGFTTLLEKYQEFMMQARLGVEEPSYFSPSASMGEGAYRGAFSYVGSNTKIGDNVKLFPNSYIGENCVIGDNVIIYAGVKIYPNTVIGNNCVFHAGAVIGSDGFGFAPLADGSYKTIPQIGNVIIEDNVSIGANATVDCATMGSTVIKKGVKLDNLVQIAHNVEVGENTVMAALAGIAGSTKIGANCMFGGHTAVAGHVNVANGTKLGGKSGISNSVEEENQQLLGLPAQKSNEFFKDQVNIKRISKILKQLKELQEKVVTLTK